jgi:DNA-binding MarR family transcriptional regulator
VDNNFVNTDIAAGGRIRPPQGDAAMVAKKSTRKPRAAALHKTAGPRRTSRPAIDLGDLDERLGYFVRRIQVWIFQDFIRRLAHLDISPAQFSVLVVIGANPGLSQAELGETLGIERARLVRLLHRLDQRALTERRSSSTDGRRHALQLTREGQKVLGKAKALAAQHEAGLKDKLGAERHRMLLEALREL